MTRSSLRLLASLAALLAAASIAAADTSAPLPRLQLQAGTHVFDVEVASTPPQRQQGLMGRTRLPANGGMLFVFERPDRHCFWMRNTPLPLSIAFIGADGRIVDLADMQPQTETLHCPSADVRYALEVSQGGFRQRGIATGAHVKGLPR